VAFSTVFTNIKRVNTPGHLLWCLLGIQARRYETSNITSEGDIQSLFPTSGNICAPFFKLNGDLGEALNTFPSNSGFVDPKAVQFRHSPGWDVVYCNPNPLHYLPNP